VDGDDADTKINKQVNRSEAKGGYMATQQASVVKVTITRELIDKSATSNEAWRELYDAIQEHMGVEVLYEAQVEGDATWPLV